MTAPEEERAPGHAEEPNEGEPHALDPAIEGNLVRDKILHIKDAPPPSNAPRRLAELQQRREAPESTLSPENMPIDELEDLMMQQKPLTREMMGNRPLVITREKWDKIREYLDILQESEHEDEPIILGDDIFFTAPNGEERLIEREWVAPGNVLIIYPDEVA